jgi:hypothetical protein
MSHLETQHKLKTLSEANLREIIKVVWIEGGQSQQLKDQDREMGENQKGLPEIMSCGGHLRQ